MKRLLLALALLFAPSFALAQCNGVFANNTVCGNATGSANTPRATNPSAFLGAAGGTNGQVQYNNAGALGGLTNIQLTALVNQFTSILSGTVPLSGGGTTNFLRADGTWTAPPGASIATGVARVFPNASQTNTAASPWQVVDPWGNTGTVNCAGTSTQCVNEALTAAAAAAWSIEIDCTGKTQAGTTPTQLFATSTITIPPGFGQHVTFKQCYINNTTSNPVVLIDSQDGSTIWLQIFPNPGANNDAVRIKPTNSVAALGGIHLLNSTIYVESAPASGTGNGCVVDSTNGAITGNDIWCQDANGGAVGLKLVVSAGTPFIIEENHFHWRFIHTNTTAGIQGMQAGATVGFCRKNTWYGGRVAPNGATDGFSTFCQNDTIIGLSISNEEGTVTNGVHLQTGANGNTFTGANVLNATTGFRFEATSIQNTFVGGSNSGGTAKVDAGTQNSFINVSGVSNAIPVGQLLTCAAAVEGNSISVTDSNTNTWGAGIAAGGANHVMAYCNGSNWTVMGK